MSRANRSDNWMPFYFADYMRDTMHLSRDEHGGYLLLIAACWAGGGRLPNDRLRLAAITKASPDEWRRLGAVLLPFFQREGKWLVHKRVLQEYEKAQRLSEARQKTGRLGGRPKKETETKPKPIANLEGNLRETPQEGGGSSSNGRDIHCPIQVESYSSTNLSEGTSGAEIIPLDGRAAR